MTSQSIAHYKVTAKLGQGGMGEVYRATDIKLGREVAIKVLPTEFASDSERLRRFEQEAKTLAAFNHPNILVIHDVGVHEGAPYLVSELLEGRTLREALKHGALPLSKSIECAQQVAKGMAAAHGKGIIHRDLKPENVFITHDGQVKVLDFGLAKLRAPRADVSSPGIDASTLLESTTRGVVLGTPAYMSPEQVRGEPADARSDIFAFGCVMHEMLSGRHAFRRDTPVETMNAVLNEEPPEPSSNSTNIPPLLNRVVRRCLEKDPDNRFQSAKDLAFALENSVTLPSINIPGTNELGPESSLNWQRALTWAAALTMGLAWLLFFLFDRGDKEETPPTPVFVQKHVERLHDSAQLSLGVEVPQLGFNSQVVTISPDGRHLVYVGRSEASNANHLYHRDLTEAFGEPRLILGTAGAIFAFFSPDSSMLGFLTTDKIFKWEVGDDGAPVPVCAARNPTSGTWTEDSIIYFTDGDGQNLNRVSASGDTSEPIFKVTERYGTYATFGSILPGGEAALVSVRTGISISAEGDIRVVPLHSTDERDDIRLGLTGYDVRYLRSGHLLYGHEGRLFAVPFSPDTMQTTGAEKPVLNNVAVESLFGVVHASVADNGTLAFVPGEDLSRGKLAWLNRQGGEGVFTNMPARLYGSFDICPDRDHPKGNRFAIHTAEVKGEDQIKIWNANEGEWEGVLPNVGAMGWPVWSPDGAAFAYTGWDSGGTPDGSVTTIMLYELHRSDPPKQLYSSRFHVRAQSWVEPGSIGISQFGESRLGVLRLEGNDSLGNPWVYGPEDDVIMGFPALLSTPEWLAYSSTEGWGGFQVWIASIDRKTVRAVTSKGGFEPVWNEATGELFFRRSNRILASSITLEPELEIGFPRELFVARDFVDTPGPSFRVSLDGQRVYYVRRASPPSRDRIHIVHNWFSELNRMAPPE